MQNKNMVFIVVILFSLFFMGCHRPLSRPEHNLVLSRSNFNSLPGWKEDSHYQALAAFKKSCPVFIRNNAQMPFSKKLRSAGNIAEWQEICAASAEIAENDDQAARRFFEFWFVPHHVYDNTNSQGLFTGYYLPTLKCSLHKSKHYRIPIYTIPTDWVKADLGMFSPMLQGKSIVGQIKGNTLFPYPERKAIIRGNIHKQTKVLAWCDDEISLAFAQIQGSARIVLPNKKHFLIGYAGSNGHTYTSLGKILIQRQALTMQNSSMQTIRQWLLQHAGQADEVLDQNASYVFFRILDTDAPLGSQQVSLTAKRSLAVDKTYIPLGVPVWLQTTTPNAETEDMLPLHRLLIAQDTGGAIKGIVRGDVYWGSGEQAEFIAGHMKSQGEYWLLLPRHTMAQ